MCQSKSYGDKLIPAVRWQRSIGWPHHSRLPEEVQTGEREKATHTEGRANLGADSPYLPHTAPGFHLTCF